MTQTSERATRRKNGYDDQLIAEFRSSGGRVGGYFEGFPLLLLHNTGARSGVERVTPLGYQAVDEDAWAVFASKGGSDENPGWYHNVLAHPETTIEVGTDRIAVRAREARGVEYQRIWDAQTSRYPTFAEYERRTARPYIPVIVLDRR